MKERIAKIITFLNFPVAPTTSGGYLLNCRRFKLPQADFDCLNRRVYSFYHIMENLSAKLPIVRTFEHELMHLIFGLLFLKRPHSFLITLQEDGSVT